MVAPTHRAERRDVLLADVVSELYYPNEPEQDEGGRRSIALGTNAVDPGRDAVIRVARRALRGSAAPLRGDAAVRGHRSAPKRCAEQIDSIAVSEVVGLPRLVQTGVR